LRKFGGYPSFVKSKVYDWRISSQIWRIWPWKWRILAQDWRISVFRKAKILRLADKFTNLADMALEMADSYASLADIRLS
jgi:hypothetical protein